MGGMTIFCIHYIVLHICTVEVDYKNITRYVVVYSKCIFNRPVRDYKNKSFPLSIEVFFLLRLEGD